MLQTVPSTATHGSDSYSAYADNFDLSLLPMDLDDVIDMPVHVSQMSTKLLPRTLTPEMNGPLFIDPKAGAVAHDIPHSPAYAGMHYQQYHADLQCYPTTLPLSPPQEPFVTIFPPSPSPSIEHSIGNTCSPTSATIKTEQFGMCGVNGLYPPSPPDSNGAPSPIHYHCHTDIKTEPYDIGPEPCLDIDALFTNAMNCIVTPNTMNQQSTKTELLSTSAYNSDQNTVNGDTKDHQLLREYLQDTTFQRKHNLKPLALESLFVGDWGVRDDIEPVISLALDHARRDVRSTCALLNISAGESFFLFFFG